MNVVKEAAMVASGGLKRRLGKADRPRDVVYKVTRRCNLFCSMCYTHDGERGQELTPSEAARFFGHPGMSGLRLLRLTGGEPFLRQDMVELTQACLSGSALPFLHLTTNGTFLDRLESWLKEVVAPYQGRVVIQVSLDAADSRHDTIRGKEGSLEKTLQALQLLKDQAKTLPHLMFGINQTIGPDNIDAMDEVAALAHSLGATHTLILAQEEHETREKADEAGAGFRLRTPLSPDQVAALQKALKKQLSHPQGHGLEAKFRALTQSYIHHHEFRQLEGQPPPRQACMAAFSYLRLSPEGDVTPCTLKNSHVLGNIRRQDFDALWEGEAAQKARLSVAACPGCWVECDVIPSFPYQPAFAAFALKKQFSLT